MELGGDYLYITNTECYAYPRKCTSCEYVKVKREVELPNRSNATIKAHTENCKNRI